MREATESKRLTYTAKELGALLGLSSKAVYSQVGRGRLPKPVHIGRRLLFPVSAVERWLEQQIEAAASQKE